MKINVNYNSKYQTYENIGASGAWWAQIVGNWDHIDPESGKSVRDRISELLYSKENGIGMQVFRYNIGAGSKHSGRGTYSEPARSTECFETAPGKYDWSRYFKQVLFSSADSVKGSINPSKTSSLQVNVDVK